MSKTGGLAPVIGIDEQKCINCYACVTACPVKYRDDYTETLSLTGRPRYDINFLAAMPADIVRAIEENDEEILSRLASMESGQH